MEERIARWYFGGVAATMAACCTHPLDTIKTILQTPHPAVCVNPHFKTGMGLNLAGIATKLQRNKLNDGKVIHREMGFFRQTIVIVKAQGIRSLYRGIMGTVLWLITSATTRFGLYEFWKQQKIQNGKQILFPQRVYMAALTGMCGGVVGNPFDVVKIRMQNDLKLPEDQKLNYKNAVDGLARIIKEEGAGKLFRGVEWSIQRAALLSIGQIAFYDNTKNFLLRTGYFHDNVPTHLTASCLAGTVATFLTQPVDVCKTLAMNARQGGGLDYKGMGDLYRQTARQGHLVFTKGFTPAFVRLGPQTVLTWVFLEQLRLNFGARKE